MPVFSRLRRASHSTTTKSSREESERQAALDRFLGTSSASKPSAVESTPVILQNPFGALPPSYEQALLVRAPSAHRISYRFGTIPDIYLSPPPESKRALRGDTKICIWSVKLDGRTPGRTYSKTPLVNLIDERKEAMAASSTKKSGRRVAFASDPPSVSLGRKRSTSLNSIASVRSNSNEELRTERAQSAPSILSRLPSNAVAFKTATQKAIARESLLSPPLGDTGSDKDANAALNASTSSSQQAEPVANVVMPHPTTPAPTIKVKLAAKAKRPFSSSEAKAVPAKATLKKARPVSLPTPSTPRAVSSPIVVDKALPSIPIPVAGAPQLPQFVFSRSSSNSSSQGDIDADLIGSRPLPPPVRIITPTRKRSDSLESFDSLTETLKANKARRAEGMQRVEVDPYGIPIPVDATMQEKEAPIPMHLETHIEPASFSPKLIETLETLSVSIDSVLLPPAPVEDDTESTPGSESEHEDPSSPSSSDSIDDILSELESTMRLVPSANHPVLPPLAFDPYGFAAGDFRGYCEKSSGMYMGGNDEALMKGQEEVGSVQEEAEDEEEPSELVYML